MRTHHFPIWLRIVAGISIALVATLAWSAHGGILLTSAFISLAALALLLVFIDIRPLIKRMDDAGWSRAFSFYTAACREERRINLARACPPVLLDSTCPRCLAPAQDGARFCYRCGEPMAEETFKFCYHCEKTVPYEAHYCPYCRFPVGEHVTDTMAHLLNPPEKTRSGKYQTIRLLPMLDDDAGSLDNDSSVSSSSGEHTIPPAWLVGYQPHLAQHGGGDNGPTSSVWDELLRTSAQTNDEMQARLPDSIDEAPAVDSSPELAPDSLAEEREHTAKHAAVRAG